MTKAKRFFSLCIFFLSAVFLTDTASADLEYTIQVMSGADRTAAEKLQNFLREQGFASYITIHEQTGMFRVRVGRYPTVQEAKKIQEQMKERNIDSWIAQADEQRPADSTPKKASPPIKTSAPGQKTSNTAGQVSHPAAADNGSHTESDPALNSQEETTEENAKPGPMEAPQPQEDTPATQAGVASAETKLYELVINPVPTMEARDPEKAEQSPAPEVCRVQTQYIYCAEDKILHIAANQALIPPRYRNKVQQVDIFPAVFKSLNLQDMSLRIETPEKTIELVLDGLDQSRQQRAGALKELEATLKAGPLRLVYLPPLTDPDGTLHGDAFFAGGGSVAAALVRQGLAACHDGFQASSPLDPCR